MTRLPLFLLSCLCAFTGGHTLNYAVILYAQEMLRSDLLSGIGFGLCFGPPLLLGWYAGVQCDRRSPVLIIHAAQGLFLLAAAGLALADMLGGGLRVPLVMLAAGMAGAGWSFAAPARMTSLGRIAAPASLKRATMIFNLLVMLGFGLGPLVIAAMRSLGGWQAVFASAGMLFALGSVLLLGLRVTASGKPHRPVMAEIGEGMRAVRADPLVLQLLLCAVFCYLLMGPMQILLPRIARAGLGLGEMGRGAFLGMLAPALIAGGMLCLTFAARIPAGRAIFLTSGIAGVVFALLGSERDVEAGVVMLGTIGLCGGIGISLIVAGLQARVPDAVRGRVMSMYTISSQSVPALSGLAAGAISQGLGAPAAALLCGGILAVAAAANGAWMTELRRWRG